MKNKLILFISSYIPLYLLLVVKNILERITDEGRFINIVDKLNSWKKFDEINDYAIVIIITLSVFSFFYLKRKITAIGSRKEYKVKSVVNETSHYYLSYISIYLISCLELSLNSIVDCFVFLFLMIIIGYIYISNNMVYMNPMLNFMGYKIYTCTLEALNTGDDDFKTILIAPQKKSVKVGDKMKGSGRQGFVCAEHIKE